MNYQTNPVQRYAIGAHDDTRIFPLLREYFLATSTSSSREQIERAFSNDRLTMVRNESFETFETWVDEANQYRFRQQEKARCV